MISEALRASLLAALNHLQIVISDEMAFQVSCVKTEEKCTEVTSLPYSLAILEGI